MENQVTLDADDQKRTETACKGWLRKLVEKGVTSAEAIAIVREARVHDAVSALSGSPGVQFQRLDGDAVDPLLAAAKVTVLAELWAKLPKRDEVE